MKNSKKKNNMKIIKENKVCKKCGKTFAGKQKWYQSVWSICWGHPWKVSELEEMIFPDDNDFIMIVDESENASKKIKIKTLVKYIQNKIK